MISGARPRRVGQPPPTGAAVQPSRAALWLSGLIAALAAFAAGVGLFLRGGDGQFAFTTLHGQTVQIYGRGLYHDDMLRYGAQTRGTDAATLFLMVPLLLIAAWGYRRGSPRAALVLTGTLGYFLYYYASLALGAAYNSLFLVYVALLGAGLYGFLLALTSIDRPALATRLSPRLHHRRVAGFLFAVALLLGAVWLTPVVAGLIQGTVPEDIGSYTTGVTYVLDLGAVVPAAVLAGVLLLRREPLGYLLATVLLVLNATIGVSLLAQAAAILLAGITMTPGQLVGLVLSFAVLTAVGIWLLLGVLREVGANERVEA